MAFTNTKNLRDEIDQLFRQYIDTIKIRTKCNLNDSAVDGEGFVRNFLNLLYGFNLNRNLIESAYNETIDLHNLNSELPPSRKICVQVTARNDKGKIDTTIRSFIKKEKYKLYDELHFFIFDREKSFSYDKNSLRNYNTDIEFHDYTTIFKKLCSLDSYESIVPIYDFIQQEIGDPLKVIQKEDHQSKILKSSLKDELENKNIIIQLHGVLKSFEGLICIHPITVSKLWPFTIGDYRHDRYSHFCLKTNNKKIHELLDKIEINNCELTLLDESLEPYKDKLLEIFTVLNHSMISCICYREKYTEIKHHKINIVQSKEDCECNYCRYNKFDIRPLFNKLKSKSIDPSEDLNEALSEAYYLFKLGESVKSWEILNKIINKTENSVVKFIAELNTINMYGSINAPWSSNEAKSILPKINKIDIPTSLYNINASIELRDELICINEDRHLHYGRKKIEDLAEKILDNKLRYNKGGMFMGPSYITLLINELIILKAYYSSNNLVHDNFFTFRNTIKKGIEAIFNSYTTAKLFDDRYKEFDPFIVSLILECLSEKQFEQLLINTNLSEIKILESAKTKILFKIKNYFEFQFRQEMFNSLTFYDDLQKQDYFSRFRQELRHLFNKIMILLEHSNYTTYELKPLTESILNFIQASEDFNHNNWKYFTQFLDKKIKAFSPKQITLIIDQSLNGKNHRAGEDQLKTICNIASRIEGFIIEDKKEIQKQFKNVTESCSKCNQLHHKETVLAYWSVFNKNGKELIQQYTIDLLSDNFDGQLYKDAVFLGVLTQKTNQALFMKFIDYAIDSCSPYDIKQEKGRWIARNFAGMNALSCLDFMGISLQNNLLKGIAEKSEFYNWVVNMQEYDYSGFDLNWLTDLCNLSFLTKNLHSIEDLKIKVENQLKDKFDDKLSIFYVKFLI